VWDRLRSFDPARPVYVESESKKVGNVAVPESLILAMRASPCLRGRPADRGAGATAAGGLRLVRARPGILLRAAAGAGGTEGSEPSWQAGRSRRGPDRWSEVFRELLEKHYDPGYTTSIQRNFRQYGQAGCCSLPAVDGSDGRRPRDLLAAEG
jgi:tRNA 2-selenouridine synthase